MRTILRYLRIEDPDGGLSLTALALLIGSAVALGGHPFGLAAFGLTLLGFHVERQREHRRALRAMQTGERVALAKRSDEAEKLSERIEVMEKRMKLLETPERAEATKKFIEMMQRRVSGLG